MSGSIKTRQNQSRKVLLHVLPHLGQVPLRDVTAARLRAYIADLEKSCSPQYARAILGALSNIFETAIDDKRLIRNPMRAKSVRWPKADEGRREAWPPETARQMRDSISDRYRITVVLGVGCGLRQGEVFGLSPDDIDYEKGVIYVRRQVQAFCGRLYFTLPKGGKTRVADMPVSVARELREHSEKYPAVEVELPRGEPGKPTRKVLLLTTRFGNAVAVNTYNTYIWKPALARVGIIPPWPAGAKPW
ncbi:tyrosine-type recombinase/integrase [Streptomyces sp. NPDC018045]|uniref:tyrosine-type recombinase/integrase n=1 Tax=Streptomyces sp. NPDC018045 TaxID=3365037 RepID=UPI0037A40D32